MVRPEPQNVETLKAPLIAKPQKAFAAAFVVLATVLAGCASGLGVNTSDTTAVGAITRVEEGHVVAVRPVDAAATAETGFAYTIKLRTGELVSVTQASAFEIDTGTPVVIEYGQRARVIPQNASIGYT
jgi:hypothetical protein